MEDVNELVSSSDDEEIINDLLHPEPEAKPEFLTTSIVKAWFKKSAKGVRKSTRSVDEDDTPKEDGKFMRKLDSLFGQRSARANRLAYIVTEEKKLEQKAYLLNADEVNDGRQALNMLWSDMLDNTPPLQSHKLIVMKQRMYNSENGTPRCRVRKGGFLFRGRRIIGDGDEEGRGKEDDTHRFMKSLLRKPPARESSFVPHPDAKMYKDEYQTRRLQLSNKLCDIFNSFVCDSKLPVIEVRWNNQLFLKTGYTHFFKKAAGGRTLVVLSTRVLTNPERLIVTLFHELCHVASGYIEGPYGRRDFKGHGAGWTYWVDKTKEVFPYLPPITVLSDFFALGRYTASCKRCNVNYQKMMSHSVTCNRCGEKCEVTCNDKNDCSTK